MSELRITANRSSEHHREKIRNVLHRSDSSKRNSFSRSEPYLGNREGNGESFPLFRTEMYSPPNQAIGGGRDISN
ncbi:hypothetical protein LEP1GSC047_4249 [Leptospira inadai serovar Lyme str. 10]|uniref:Uncharacterized protein n=2 Tax=Leptospira inadai serovar Lyme TaxID=293084 RepID=V6HX32_9LEPT|nr:hypothetical protein LEP1GSC047_4249 [Leptospira inadai serovar Lyme str. 10]PNV73308.1 hypothetical protein BES34_017600 [Leptospira inadai serovar Lyme]